MLKVYTLAESEQWDAVVRSIKDYDVYYLSGYVKAFKLHGDGEPLLFYCEGDGTRGINVVMKRDIANDIHFVGMLPIDTYFDFATPYGYGGWLIEGMNTNGLLDEYEKWCLKHNIVSEFVRFHPLTRNYISVQGFYEIAPLGSTVSMDLSSPESIWVNMTSKNRNMVRKAQRSGIVIYNGRYPEIFQKFRELYNQTMDKDNAEAYYYFKPEFYQRVMFDLASQAQVFYAEIEGTVIAASIMLAANGRLNYYLSGSLREHQNLAPTNLMLYTAALWGYYNGCKTFHLGGGVGSSEDSLYKFKSAFYRGKSCRFHIGRKVHIEDKYKELVDMRDKREIENKGFFPKYRA